jgi:hypothetical protein
MCTVVVSYAFLLPQWQFRLRVSFRNWGACFEPALWIIEPLAICCFGVPLIF